MNLTLTDSEGTQHTATTDASGVAEFTSVAYGSATLYANGKEFTPNTITVSASAGSFIVEMSQLYVDLGLPSGLKWCSYNIGATSPEDYGYYFSWGNVDGHVRGSGYNFSSSKYESTRGHSLTGNIPVNDTYDIARKIMGSTWRLPTNAEFKELYDNTDSEWVGDYNGTGVKGCKFMKKSDHSVYIFFPICGQYDGTYLHLEGTYSYYWSSTYYDSNNANCMVVGSGDIFVGVPENRYHGCSGRAVQ